MKIRIVDSETGFDALEEEWNRLSGTVPRSLFSSFDYVRTAWRHFHVEGDRPLILVIDDGLSVVGIAPFYVRWERRLGIPHRFLRLIASWEGDRPGILADEARLEECWTEVLRFLTREYRAWEVLELMEQPSEGPAGRGWSCLSRRGLYWEQDPDAVGYYISLEGTWQEYVEQLRPETRHEWRRKLRNVASNLGPFTVEQVADPGRMAEALTRFVSLEQAGWKAGAGIGAGKDARHLAFYADLLDRLARKGQARIYLLTGPPDLAGGMCFVQRDVVYFRHTAYSPAFSKFSPGILIQASILEELFGGEFRELDLQGMKESGPGPRHKTQWATGRRETVQWIGYRVASRILPLLVAKRLKRWSAPIRERLLRRRRAGGPPAEAAKQAPAGGGA
jgi:CelD/BcsL family acetyltransferase involved in cellulose biosynthesis